MKIIFPAFLLRISIRLQYLRNYYKVIKIKMNNILEVKNLTKVFTKNKTNFVAVDKISFTLKEGEILGILGPNGAGKTTTIQMLLGVLHPTSGQILYFGKDFTQYREEILEKVNFSSAYTNLPWNLTVRENLQYLSYLYTLSNRQQRIKRIIDLFRIEPLLNQPIEELSAGQLSRVNIAKAFLNFPKILLLDEPTASLDPEVAKYIRDFLLHEQEKFRTSIILTSHNMAEVEEVCDRVIFINYGKIVADDTPENLARSLQVCHINFLIRDGLKRMQEYAIKKKLNHNLDGRYITVDIKEKEIGHFLLDIAKKGIIFDEISIAKPTLEDYFLSLIHI